MESKVKMCPCTGEPCVISSFCHGGGCLCAPGDPCSTECFQSSGIPLSQRASLAEEKEVPDVISPLPKTSSARKDVPMAAGLLDYFPAALAEVARVSKAGNDQHNPGQPMHHARGKSMDHADCIIRHLVDRGTTDVDGMRHSAKVAWRALALLQEELEADGAPLARGAMKATTTSSTRPNS